LLTPLRGVQNAVRSDPVGAASAGVKKTRGVWRKDTLVKESCADFAVRGRRYSDMKLGGRKGK